MVQSGLDNAEEAQFEAEFEDRLEAVIAQPDPSPAVRPYLFKQALSFAVLSQDGLITWCDQKFHDRFRLDALDFEASRSVGPETAYITSLAKDAAGRPVLLIHATPDLAQRWIVLNPDLATQLRAPDCIIVAAFSLSHLGEEIEYAGRAMGFTNLEARVSAALFAHGSIRRAAPHAGVSYHTARKALSSAMKTAGVSRQTSLVRKLSELATVATPPRDAVEKILIDMFRLSRRDAKLVHLLCEGYTRTDAARIAGISAAVAKDRYSHIFQSLEVGSATDLPPLIMSAFGAAVLLHEVPPVIHSTHRARPPLRLVRSEDGRTIAVNDYGPNGAHPVLIAHSSLSTRHPFKTLVDALQADGFRPFTIDRPGFGLTDDLDEMPDRFATGTQDAIRVCDALGFEQTHVITRGGAFHVLALARQAPNRLGQVVVINPDLLQHDCSQRKGHLGMVRLAFDRYPASVEKVARWTAASLSKQRVETIIRAGIGDAPADLKSFSDPQNFDDYARSVMAFSTGQLSGFIREQRGYVLQTQIEGLSDASNWTILLGGSDPIHDVNEIRSFWTGKLPGAHWRRFDDAGRFISLSHTQEIVSALKAA